MSGIIDLFGRRVKYLRIKQKLSQEKLAELSGLHPTYIGQVERGEKNCTLETAEKIAEGLGVPLTELLVEQPLELSKELSSRQISEIEGIVSRLVKLSDEKMEAVSVIVEQIAGL